MRTGRRVSAASRAGLTCLGALASSSVRAAPEAGLAGNAVAASLAVLGVLLAMAVGILGWSLHRERRARLEAEASLERERSVQRIAAERRARHFSAMGREGCQGLGALESAIDLVDGPRLEPATRLHVAALRRAATALGAQLSYALDYEAIEQGRVRPRPQRTDVVTLMRDVASQSSAEAADRRVAFALFVPQHPFPAMRVDPHRMRQIADAMIREAIGRLEHGEVRVELRYRRITAGGIDGWLTVSVHDDGPALDADLIGRLQAAIDDSIEHTSDIGPPSDPAAGVGLWRAGRLARALGGALQLAVAPSARGLTRELRLPVRLDAEGAARGALLEDLNAGFGRPELPAGGATRGRLLLVEDDRVVQFTVEHQLGRFGYDVCCADDAEEALELWRAAPTPFVVTDLGLPGRDGVSLIAAIRDIERARGLPRARVVVLTGEVSHVARSYEAGADEVLAKPVTGERLEQVLAQVTLGGREAPAPRAAPAAGAEQGHGEGQDPAQAQAQARPLER
jgi:CheY-like chemotaxis protein